MKAMLYEKQVPIRHLIIGYGYFVCPYCHHAVQRGGHAEGFRKSGMNNHVAACREILLYEKGYLPGPWDHSRGKQTAIKILEKPDDFQKRVIRQIKARIRQRARDGLKPMVKSDERGR